MSDAFVAKRMSGARRLETLATGSDADKLSGMESAVRRLGLRRYWPPVAAVALIAAAIAAIVIADTEGGNIRVYLVLAHPTMRAGGSDAVVAVNKSYEALDTAGVSMTPRTSASFSSRFPHAMMFDDPRNAVAPYSKRRIWQPAWSTYPPGKYWVWMAYGAGGSKTLYAYTKLTIVAH